MAAAAHEVGATLVVDGIAAGCVWLDMKAVSPCICIYFNKNVHFNLKKKQHSLASMFTSLHLKKAGQVHAVLVLLC